MTDLTSAEQNRSYFFINAEVVFDHTMEIKTDWLQIKSLFAKNK